MQTKKNEDNKEKREIGRGSKKTCLNLQKSRKQTIKNEKRNGIKMKNLDHSFICYLPFTSISGVFCNKK